MGGWVGKGIKSIEKGWGLGAVARGGSEDRPGPGTEFPGTKSQKNVPDHEDRPGLGSWPGTDPNRNESDRAHQSLGSSNPNLDQINNINMES